MKNMFLKIDKKVLIVISVILAVVLIAAFVAYKYSSDAQRALETNNEENKIETANDQTVDLEETVSEQNGDKPSVDINIPTIDTQPGLTVCVEKCGDGICQPAGTACNDNLNCTCAETREDCPQDCK